MRRKSSSFRVFAQIRASNSGTVLPDRRAPRLLPPCHTHTQFFSPACRVTWAEVSSPASRDIHSPHTRNLLDREHHRVRLTPDFSPVGPRASSIQRTSLAQPHRSRGSQGRRTARRRRLRRVRRLQRVYKNGEITRLATDSQTEKCSYTVSRLTTRLTRSGQV